MEKITDSRIVNVQTSLDYDQGSRLESAKDYFACFVSLCRPPTSRTSRPTAGTMCDRWDWDESARFGHQGQVNRKQHVTRNRNMDSDQVLSINSAYKSKHLGL